MFTHYYWTEQALSLPHGDSVWTPVCSCHLTLHMPVWSSNGQPKFSCTHIHTVLIPNRMSVISAMVMLECGPFYCFLSLTVRRTIYQLCMVWQVGGISRSHGSS